MIGIPQADEAAPYYFRYIDLVTDGNVLQVLRAQMEEALSLFSGISEEKSLHRYQPDKWSIREVLGHMNDTERVLSYRALSFARAMAVRYPVLTRRHGLQKPMLMIIPGPATWKTFRPFASPRSP